MYLFKVNLEHSVQTFSVGREHDLNEKLIEILKDKSLVSQITIDNWNESVKEVVRLMNRNKNA